MNVLFVSSSFSKDTSAYTYNLLLLKEGIKKYGVNANILYLGDYFFRTPELIQSINIPLLLKLMKNYEIFHGGGLSASYVLGLAKHLLRARTKIIYNIKGDLTAEYLLCRRNILDPFFNYKIVESIIMEPIAIRCSDYFVACSKALKQRYIYKGIDEERIEVIHHGVDVELVRPNEESSKNETFTITYAGAFQKWQGVKNLVKAARLLSGLDIKLKIIGFTERDFILKREISQELGNKAELIDRLPRAELIRQLCKSDILIIPRSRDNATEVAFPTKFVEYIAVGKPIIVTNVDETSEFVKKYDCGFVCEPNVKSIADTIKEAKEASPKILLRKGMNSRQLAEHEFDIRVISRQYFDFLCKITEK